MLDNRRLREGAFSVVARSLGWGGAVVDVGGTTFGLLEQRESENPITVYLYCREMDG